MVEYISDFMAMAVKMARDNAASGKGGPFAALVVRDGEVIASATNSVTGDNGPTAHAEVNAIRSACRKLGSFQLNGCVIYTSCEPCPMCLGAIYWARPDAVYYASTKYDAAKVGFDDSFIYEELELAGDKRSIPFIHKKIELKGDDEWKLWSNFGGKTEY